MKGAKRLFLLMLLTTVSLTAFTQDSLRLVPVRAWQLSRMIDEVTRGRICDSLVRVQDRTLSLADSIILSLEGQRVNLIAQRDAAKAQSASWEAAYNTSVKACAIEKKKYKGQGRREGAALVGTLIILLMII